MVPGPGAWLVVAVVPLRPSTQPEGGSLSNRDLGEHLRLQPVVDPCSQISIQKATNKLSKYCPHRYLRKKIPGWSSSATQDPECPAQMRSAVVLVTASSGPNKKQRHPDLSSCNVANYSLDCQATSYSRCFIHPSGQEYVHSPQPTLRSRLTD